MIDDFIRKKEDIRSYFARIILIIFFLLLSFFILLVELDKDKEIGVKFAINYAKMI